jgi:hypothetical protein
MDSRQGSSTTGHPTQQERPLDGALATLVDRARGSGRGFAVDVATDLDAAGRREVVYRVEQVLPPADEWEPPAPYRAHALENIASVVTFARRYGDAARSVVFYDDSRVEVVLDETPARGIRERAVMTWKYSPDLRDWQQLLGGKAIDHRALMDFFMRHQQTLVEATILDRMREVRAMMHVKVDSDLRLDGETAGVVFESQAGPSLIQFPRRIEVMLPVLDGDVVADASWIRTMVHVEVMLPREPKQPVSFALFAPALLAEVRLRIDVEIAAMCTELDGWTVLRGRHGEVPRELGREGQHCP